MLHHLKKATAPGGALALACALTAACTGVPLSAPPLPAPPPPPPGPPPIAWAPRAVPSAPAWPVRPPLERPARLSAAAAPPPAPDLHGLKLEPVPEVAAPSSFCSLDQKYAFIDERQLPAYDAAMRNNVQANAYKAELADLYVQYRNASAGAVHSGEVLAELKRGRCPG